jgi:uncharacterized protein (TIGR00255 family)
LTDKAEMQSMTGFGSAGEGPFTVEIRSVNHRYFDVFFRTPNFINKYEIELKRRLKKNFSRGRFEVTVSVSPEKINEIKINDALIADIIRALDAIKENFSVKGDITLDLLTGFKDILVTDNASFDEQSLFITFDGAIKKLYDMRVSEGKYIKSELMEMLKTVEEYIRSIIDKSDGIQDKLRQRFIRKFMDLVDNSSVDEGRLVQEASLLAERADISEEVARLQSHIKQFTEIVSGGGPVGRKLDFLLQEFFREANTIASKTSEYGIISVIVDMKNEIERLREQVQNIQ